MHITNLVFIDASQNAVHNAPSAQTFAVGVLVVRFRLNFCTNEFQSTEGFSSTMHFSASPGGARAQGDIVLCDLDSTVGGCQEQTFALDVTWTGVGNVTVDHSTLANLTAAGGFTSTTTGTSRAANATGSMTSGNLNLITTPSSSGVISTAKAHNVILSP